MQTNGHPLHCEVCEVVSGSMVCAGADVGAAAAAANAEEIDIGDVDDELDDADEDGSATAQPKGEESMFAAVEIHNFDPTGGEKPEQEGDSKTVPEAIANVFRQ